MRWLSRSVTYWARKAALGQPSEQLRVAPAVELTDEQEVELKLARSKRTSVRLAQRAQLVLLAAKGLQNKDIAAQLGIGRVQVYRWRER